ncbi:MAG: glycoside hydrolase family 15 protein [Chloroflexota bacterium]
MTPPSLYQQSLAIIHDNQAPGGAYLACPNFPTYRYSWFRDGAYIAYAMNLAGEHDSAARFHDWAAATIVTRADAVERAIAAGQRGEVPHPADQLHTRYATNGTPGDEEWPNFQLDGLGTWLWALGQHHLQTDTLPSPAIQTAVALVSDYLAALWRVPCYDCWEEFPDKIHPYTLAAIFGGLGAAEDLIGVSHSGVRAEIRDFVLREGVTEGRFVKYVGGDLVDASLLGLAVPYGLVAPDDPLMIATVAEIQSTLTAGGGVHRYAGDTYYGGGQWVLLTAWLGWYLAACNRQPEAAELLAWVEAQTTPQGWLPEQVPAALNDPATYEPWRTLWGDIASPLLWSHAKYIILRHTL